MNETHNRPSTRTLTDDEINPYAVYYPHHQDNDTTSHPCIELGGNEDGDGAMQVYAYARNGQLIISLHFDTAGPDEDGNGPWAYYGPDNAIPVVIDAGGETPAWQATAGANPGGQGIAQAVLAAYKAGWEDRAVFRIQNLTAAELDDVARMRTRGGSVGAESPPLPLILHNTVTGQSVPVTMDSTGTMHPDPELPIWNVMARVSMPVTALTGPDAIDKLHGALTRAGFDPLSAPDYSEAAASLNGTWQVTQAVVANRRAPYGARARTELADALHRAGFQTAAPQPRDWFEAEDGTRVTELPAETALRRAGERDPQEGSEALRRYQSRTPRQVTDAGLDERRPGLTADMAILREAGMDSAEDYDPDPGQ